MKPIIFYTNLISYPRELKAAKKQLFGLKNWSTSSPETLSLCKGGFAQSVYVFNFPRTGSSHAFEYQGESHEKINVEALWAYPLAKTAP